MTKEDLFEKINECKKIFVKHADTFFKLNDPDLFSEISDLIEKVESEIVDDDSEEFLTTMYGRFQSFIDMIESTEYFYMCGKYNLTDAEKKRFSYGIKTHGDKAQAKARDNMDQEALRLLDIYVANLDFMTTEILKKIPIHEGCLALYKSLNFISANKFCDTQEAGVTIVIRVRATVKPPEGIPNNVQEI